MAGPLGPIKVEKGPGRANASAGLESRVPGQANASTANSGQTKTVIRSIGAESDTGHNDVNTQAIFDSISVVPNTVYLLWCEYATDFLKTTLAQAAGAAKIEEKYLLCISLWVLFVVSGLSSTIFIVLISLAVPGVESLKALESRNPERIRRWLKYWVVFGIVNSIEFIVPSPVAKVLSLSFFKAFLLLWCVLPIEPNGTEVVYRKFVSWRARGELDAATRLLDSYLGRFGKIPSPVDARTAQLVARCANSELAPTLSQVEIAVDALRSTEQKGKLVESEVAYELHVPQKAIQAKHYVRPAMIAAGAGVTEASVSSSQKIVGSKKATAKERSRSSSGKGSRRKRRSRHSGKDTVRDSKQT